MARNLLDGPATGYGPLQAATRRGVPRSTVVLALLCVLLTIALAVVLLQRRPPPAGTAVAPATPTVTIQPSPTTASPSASPSASPTTSGITPATDASERAGEPAGVREAATEFLRAWREPSAEVRVRLMSEVATESLTEKLTDVDPAKIPHAKPVGQLVIGQASDFAAIADQRLSNHSTVRMQLVYDPASRYGWLVDTIAPLT
jgi:hypothetical protein